MGRRRGSASVALILLVLGVLGMAVVVLTGWPASVPVASEAAVRTRPVKATVISSEPCGARTSGDVVEVTVDGRTTRARLDGCGHTAGQQLDVRVPVDPGSDFVVRPASEGDSESGAEAPAQRLVWVLATLAGVAGGGYGLLVRPRSAVVG
ncbi:hypothetical protein HUO13_05420 [Saccharopolyspora erythraea]|uniref:hypothetical protein n=1 Tax=Saccharopolyspora erythraea TaxID=1836 RepID=UPI001BAB5C59|nr:hypothetical protein [Saccharopolyspora erythraea]QUH00333.1 hypothetical protein HUO13_05420 [Saccharopolyspora erythraea]